MSRRHPYRRLLFAGLVLSCWVVGLFGLDRGRMSSFQLPIVVGAGLIGYWLVGAVRRKLEMSGGAVAHEIHEPPPCVFVRQLGEASQPARAVAPMTRASLEAAPAIRPPRERPKPPARNYIPLNG